MDKEALERLRVDAQNEDHECIGGKTGTIVYTDDLRALITAYEERGKVLEYMNCKAAEIEHHAKAIRNARAHLNKDSANG